MFRQNVGGIDRVLRVTLGTVLFLTGLLLLAENSLLGAIVAVVGLIALATGIVRFCGLYIPFGISTTRPERQSGQVKRMCRDVSTEKTQSRCCTGKPAAASEKEVGGAAVTTDETR
jgi:hypothetical protein